MCRAVACRTCGKTTWSGCGMHVDQVMAGVPASNRCAGHDKEPRKDKPARQGGWLSRRRGG